MLRKFISFENAHVKTDISFIKQISCSTAESFHMQENIFGSVKSSINYGAFVHDDLVAVMSARESIYNTHVQYELTRFSYAYGIDEIKTFTQLLNAF